MLISGVFGGDNFIIRGAVTDRGLSGEELSTGVDRWADRLRAGFCAFTDMDVDNCGTYVAERGAY